MKRFWLLLFLLFFACIGVYSQSVLYKMPQELVIKPSSIPSIGDSTMLPEDYYLTEFLFPIGWSKDGKLAYIIIPADEACGCYMFMFFIKDLKTDSMLVSYMDTTVYSYNSYQRGSYKSVLQKAWYINYNMISETLYKNDIMEFDFKLETFPCRIKRDNIEIEVLTESNDNCLYGEVSKYKISLLSEKKGSIAVCNGEYNCEEEVSPLSIEISGFLQSPFEERIVLIGSFLERGFEGPPNVYRYKFISVK